MTCDCGREFDDWDDYYLEPVCSACAAGHFPDDEPPLDWQDSGPLDDE